MEATRRNDSALGKLKRVTLVDQVAESLIQYIAENRLVPGDGLPSSVRLAEEFGVSVPVIREAFTKLEAQSIIEVSNGRRAIISHISSEPLLGFFQRVMQIEQSAVWEVIEVRRALEMQSAALAAQRRCPQDVEAMQQIMREMHEKIYDLDCFTDLDLRLHLAIAQAARNKVLLRLIESLRETLKEHIREGRRRRFSQKEITQVLDLHEAVVAAIATGDPDQARQAMLQHFDPVAMSIGEPSPGDSDCGDRASEPSP